MACAKLLDLCNTHVPDLPALSEEAKITLRRLYASRSSLVKIPCDYFVGLSNLAELDLSGNKLVSLPMGIGRMSSLRKCYLQNNLLKDLPSDLTRAGSCPDLRELWVDHNELTSLPNDWSGPQRLVCLQLGWNRISALPRGICELRLLQQLLVQQNNLDSLPENLGKLSRLHCLAVRSNRLRSLPVSIGRLPHLNRVLLGVNPLGLSPCCGLPPSFGHCPVSQLYLSACNLKYVPEALQSFASTLTWIDISDNDITELPEWMSTLKVMKWLDCEDNSIERFEDPVLQWLTKLNGVGLHGNPLQSPLEKLGSLDAADVPRQLRSYVTAEDSSSLPSLVHACNKFFDFLPSKTTLFALHGTPHQKI